MSWETIDTIAKSHPYAAFFILYALGRPFCILYAIYAHIPILFAVPAVVACDAMQVPLFKALYGWSSSKLKIHKRMRERFHKKSEKAEKRSIFLKMRPLGKLGVFLICLLPLKGCGVWSSVLLAHAIQTRKREMFFLVIAGSLAGSLLILLPAMGLVEGLKFLLPENNF